MRFVPAKCCNCGANLEVYEKQDTALCNYCGSLFLVEKAIKLYEESQEPNNAVFEIISGILKKYKGADINVVIPEGVLEIAPNAFDNGKYINSIVLPASLKKIPRKAFSGFGNLTSVVIKQLECISDGAFADCCNLRDVQLPNNLKIIGNSAFSMCRSLESIDLPDSLETIGKRAFEICDKLKHVKLSTNLKTIGEYAFTKCLSLDSIILPDSLETLNEGIFANCSGLKTVKIPDDILIIPYHAFKGCSALKEINIPSKLKEISIRAFEDCKSLSHFTFSSSIMEIGNYIFCNCISLEEVVFQSKLKSIPQGLFMNCSSLKHIKLPDNLEIISSDSFAGCCELTEISFPDSLKMIENHSFSNCTSLTTVHIPQNTVWEVYAFNRCPSVKISNMDQITKLWLAAEESNILWRNNILGENTYLKCDFFHPGRKVYSKRNFERNVPLVFVNSSFQKGYKEKNYSGYFNYGDVNVFDFVFLNDFYTNYVGYKQDMKDFDKESNYSIFSSDLDSNREKIQNLLDFAGIKNYSIYFLEAPIVEYFPGFFSSRYSSVGKRQFLCVQIPYFA